MVFFREDFQLEAVAYNHAGGITAIIAVDRELKERVRIRIVKSLAGK
jgi:hypothetical protein